MLKDVSLGVVRFEESGLKMIRFVSAVPKQQLNFDRIRLLKDRRSAGDRIETGRRRNTGW